MLINKKEIPQVSNVEMNMIHADEVDIANKFYDILKEGNIEEADRLFKEFLKNVEEHFSEEEQMMIESRYWARAMHKSEHDTMREKLYNLYENWKENKSIQEVIEFLEREYAPWLNLHISRWDAETAMHIGDSE